ncbi:MAG: hypothetical protein MUE46_18385 [Xanthomonadales bacterium]|jgi:hypothetical protein|nr:hypothetical protein [Xanthomonadales bacterium]
MVNRQPLRLALLPAALLLALSGCTSVETRPEPVLTGEQTVVTAASTRAMVAPAEAPDGTVEPAQVYAAELLSPALLNGPRHRVQPQVDLLGGMALFRIETEYGLQEALGVESLERRITELDVLVELDRISRLGTFASAAGESLGNTAEAVGNVFSRPEETFRGIPEGIKRRASRLWARLKVGAKNVNDDVRQYFRGDAENQTHNPFLPPLLEPTPPATEEEAQAAREARAREVAGGVALDYIGYSSARRELSRRLGIDPYTSNPLVHERLDRLSWSALAGSASTGMALSAIAGGANVVLSKSRQLNSLVWDLSPEELDDRNRRLLRDLGYDNETARRLMRNNAFSPSQRTSLVDALAALRPVRGHELLVEWARNAEDRVEARFILSTLDLMLAPANGEDLVSVTMHRRVPVFVDREGRQIVGLPVDVLQWTADSASFFNTLGETRMLEVRIFGLLSPAMQQQCTARGWACRSHAMPLYAMSYAEVLR